MEFGSVKCAKFCSQNEFIIYTQNLFRKFPASHCEASGSLDGLLHNAARYHYQLYVQKQIQALHYVLSLFNDNKTERLFLKNQSRVLLPAELSVAIVLFGGQERYIFVILVTLL